MIQSHQCLEMLSVVDKKMQTVIEIMIEQKCVLRLFGCSSMCIWTEISGLRGDDLVHGGPRGAEKGPLMYSHSKDDQ